MSRDTWDTNTPDPEDVDPPLDASHAAWLHAPSGWTWDNSSLLMSEYVGAPLYLRLRARMTELRIPASAHDVLIQEMIDQHDTCAVSVAQARSTMITWDVSGQVQPVEVLDATEFAALSCIE